LRHPPDSRCGREDLPGRPVRLQVRLGGARVSGDGNLSRRNFRESHRAPSLSERALEAPLAHEPDQTHLRRDPMPDESDRPAPRRAHLHRPRLHGARPPEPRMAGDQDDTAPCGACETSGASSSPSSTRPTPKTPSPKPRRLRLEPKRGTIYTMRETPPAKPGVPQESSLRQGVALHIAVRNNE